jgi:hypothetical protein
MKDLAKIRLALLAEIKEIIAFFQRMERDVKTRNPHSIYPAYVFIKTLRYHVREGDLTPLMVELHQELLHQELLEIQKNE